MNVWLVAAFIGAVIFGWALGLPDKSFTEWLYAFLVGLYAVVLLIFGSDP